MSRYCNRSLLFIIYKKFKSKKLGIFTSLDVFLTAKKSGLCSVVSYSPSAASDSLLNDMELLTSSFYKRCVCASFIDFFVHFMVVSMIFVVKKKTKAKPFQAQYNTQQ